MIPGAWLLVWVSLAANPHHIPSLQVVGTVGSEGWCRRFAQVYNEPRVAQWRGYFVCIKPPLPPEVKG